MPLELTGPQFGPLSIAFRSRLTLNQFDRMLKERLDISREDISLGEDYTDILFKVIREANSAGWVYQLVDAARQVRPNESVFVEYAHMLGIGLRGLPETAELQGIIRASNSMLNLATFLSRAGEIVGQVCRVDLQGEGEGTGFLIGPNAVLTSYHVIESIMKNEHSVQELTCCFDFKVRADGTSVNKGTSRQVIEIAACSAYDPADLNKHGQLPNPDNLDYALLLLEGAPGNEPIGEGTETGDRRGWIRIPETLHNFLPQSPLFIVQHPNRRPMKLALDTQAVIGLNGNNTRVEYKINTEPGSSGSPCFSQDWDLVALHHSGDPNWVPVWNEGIPINLIVDHLKKTPAWQYVG